MILPDTSIWIAHFRGQETPLDDDQVVRLPWLLHPYVYGELLLGGLPKAGPTRDQLSSLSAAPVGSPAEANAFILWAELAGTGIGFVDSNLLLSARLSSAKLVTLDQRLRDQAKRLGVAYAP